MEQGGDQQREDELQFAVMSASADDKIAERLLKGSHGNKLEGGRTDEW